MNPIVEKIKKLLRMKHGGTPAEVETALAMARDIAAKHGIDIAAVDPDEYSEQRRVRHQDAVHFGRVPCECNHVLLILQRFFNVSTILSSRHNRHTGQKRTGITFVGTSWDIQIAIYIFSFLVRHFRHEWKTNRGRCRNRQAFFQGMYYGICETLRKTEKADPATAGLELFTQGTLQRDRYIAQAFGRIEEQEMKPPEKVSAAVLAGYRRGLETKINRGVENAPEQPKLLLT